MLHTLVSHLPNLFAQVFQPVRESVTRNPCTQHLKFSQGDAGLHTLCCDVAFIQCSLMYIALKQGWMYSSPLKFSEDEMVQDHTACSSCTVLCSQQLLPSHCVYKASFSALSSGESEGYLKYLQQIRNKSQHSLMVIRSDRFCYLIILLRILSPNLHTLRVPCSHTSPQLQTDPSYQS